MALPNFGAPVPPGMAPRTGGPPPGGPGGPPPGGPPMGAPPGGPPSPASMDEVGSALSQGVAEIRPVAQALQMLAEKYPPLGPIVGQMMPLVKQMVVTMAQMAPTQTDSASALPMGGG